MQSFKVSEFQGFKTKTLTAWSQHAGFWNRATL